MRILTTLLCGFVLHMPFFLKAVSQQEFIQTIHKHHAHNKNLQLFAAAYQAANNAQSLEKFAGKSKKQQQYLQRFFQHTTHMTCEQLIELLQANFPQAFQTACKEAKAVLQYLIRKEEAIDDLLTEVRGYTILEEKQIIRYYEKLLNLLERAANITRSGSHINIHIPGIGGYTVTKGHNKSCRITGNMLYKDFEDLIAKHRKDGLHAV